MVHAVATAPEAPPVGRLLKSWRSARRWSQLDLALEADISARHLSFVETGRARPSREMVLRLADVLELSLRDTNLLLDAAGFAQAYRESDLAAPEMAHVRQVLNFILERNDPYPAIAFDRYWNILMTNESAMRSLAVFFDPAAVWGEGPPNLMHAIFHPKGMRSAIVNWEEVGAHLINRIHREAAASAGAGPSKELLEALLKYPDLPDRWHAPDPAHRPEILLPTHLKKDGLDVRLFSTITSLGTAQDVTLQELRIESFFPADPDSDAAIKSLAA